MVLNSVLRAEAISVIAGGKGINVARAVKRLGGRAKALGVIGGDTGLLIADKVKAEGIDFKYVCTNGESRNCYGLIDRSSGVETIINEYGPTLGEKEINDFIDLYEAEVLDGDIVVLSGSVAKGFNVYIYNKLMEIAKTKAAVVILDASGLLLANAINESPLMLKVNHREFESLVGKKIDVQKELINEIEYISKKYSCAVIVTNGKADVTALVDGVIWEVTPPLVKSVNSWGSGDCFLAAIAYGYEHAKPVDHTLRLAVATGAANTLSYGAACFSVDMVYEFYEKIKEK
ncbi:MAG: hexose kinase [Candidatus Magnetoovum sp. WYHC-5]|nr:hexose kinase [Candidatus Magnetoovum sp. WYHC-5]